MICPLHNLHRETRVWGDYRCRVILVDDTVYAGSYLVVWNAHVAETSNLAPAERGHLFTAVIATERALRTLIGADKVNAASRRQSAE